MSQLLKGSSKIKLHVYLQFQWKSCSTNKHLIYICLSFSDGRRDWPSGARVAPASTTTSRPTARPRGGNSDPGAHAQHETPGSHARVSSPGHSDEKRRDRRTDRRLHEPTVEAQFGDNRRSDSPPRRRQLFIRSQGAFGIVGLPRRGGA